MNNSNFGYPTLIEQNLVSGYNFPETKPIDKMYGYLKKKDQLEGFPGLSLYLEPDSSQIELNELSKVRAIYDKSPRENNFTQSNSSLTPSLVTDSNGYSVLRFISDNGLFAEDNTKFNFLHDGNKHGVYVIYKPDASSNNKLAPILWSTDTTQNGYILFYDDRDAIPRVDRIVKQIGKSGAVPVNNSTADGFAPQGTTQLIRDVYVGTDPFTTDSKIFKNISETESSTADTSATLGTGNSKGPLGLGARNFSGAGLAYFDVYLVLVYNWTTYPTSEILEFDKKISNIINSKYSQLLGT